jgi:hypothetical protein
MSNNKPYMIRARRVNQWVRRFVIRWFGWAFARWVLRKQIERGLLAAKWWMDKDERERLRNVSWKLGLGGFIRLTPAETLVVVLDEFSDLEEISDEAWWKNEAEMARGQAEIIDRVLNEEWWKDR